LLNLRRLEAPLGLPPFQPQTEIDAVLRRRLDPGECPARRDERDIGLARLNRDLAETRRGVDESVEDRPELRPVCVLSVNELIGRRKKKVRVAEPLHDQERLCVACHALLREPHPKRLLFVHTLPPDSPIPCLVSVPRVLLQEPHGHVLHSLPVTRLGHHHSCRATVARWMESEKNLPDS